MIRTATVEDVLLGGARWCVIEGDCLEVMAGMGDGCVDHVITYPPYSERTHKGHDAGGSDGSARRDLDYSCLSLEQVAIISKIQACIGRGWQVVLSDSELCLPWRRGFEGAGLTGKGRMWLDGWYG